MKPLHGNLKITWWQGFDWSDVTCDVRDEDGYWISECDHLTDFTLVVVSGTKRQRSFRTVCKKTLAYAATL